MHKLVKTCKRYCNFKTWFFINWLIILYCCCFKWPITLLIICDGFLTSKKICGVIFVTIFYCCFGCASSLLLNSFSYLRTYLFGLPCLSSMCYLDHLMQHFYIAIGAYTSTMHSLFFRTFSSQFRASKRYFLLSEN